MRPPRPLPPLCLAATLVLATPLRGHDFWIEPTTHAPVPGRWVGIGLRVGEHFVGDRVPRDPALIARFEVRGPGGTAPLPGVTGRDPAGLLRVERGGDLVVAYEAGGGVSELSAERMAVYVAEEGLEPQLAPGWRERPLVRDRFSRSAKALLRAGEGDGVAFGVAAGLPLELVPLVDPTRLAGGGSLPLRLLERGRGSGGVRVTAIAQHDPLRPVTAVTAGDGSATLTLPSGGRWLVKAVRIRPAAAGSGADSESLWSSLTFEAPR